MELFYISLIWAKEGMRSAGGAARAALFFGTMLLTFSVPDATQSIVRGRYFTLKRRDPLWRIFRMPEAVLTRSKLLTRFAMPGHPSVTDLLFAVGREDVQYVAEGTVIIRLADGSEHRAEISVDVRRVEVVCSCTATGNLGAALRSGLAGFICDFLRMRNDNLPEDFQLTDWNSLPA